MRRLMMALTALCLICAAGCSLARERALTAAERTAIADSIRAIARGLAQSANALDANYFARISASDPELTWASDGNLQLMPRDSMLSMYGAFYRSLRKMDFAWDTLRVSVLGRDAAVLSGAGHFTVTDTTNHTDQMAVAVTYVFVRRDQGWQVLHGHSSHRPLQPAH